MKKLLIALFLAIFLVVPIVAEAAVAVTNNTLISLGNKRMRLFDVAFDSSYSIGGESLSVRGMGFSQIDQVRIEPKDGYTFEYDTTNSKIKVFSVAPAMVYEESHAATALATGYSGFYLDYPAAWIVSMADTTGPQIWVKTGLTTALLGTDEFCLYEAISDGGRTAIVTATSGTYYVTYATQAWADLYAELVQAEAVTLTPVTAVPLAYSIMAFGYCNLNTDSNNLLPIDPADTPASGEIGINYGNTSTLEANAGQGAYTTTVTYLKLPASGWIYDRYISDEDPVTAASGAYTKATLDYPVLLWGTSCYATSNGGTSRGIALSYTNAVINWVADFNVGSSAPAGASVVTTGRGTVWVTGNVQADSTMSHAVYIKGRPWEIPNLKPLEIKNTSDLSGLTDVKFQVIGR